MAPSDGQKSELEAARAVWADIAVRARTVHCPEHYVGPGRIAVVGSTPAKLHLNVSGCCPKIGEAVTAVVRADPRVGGPS